MIGKKIRSEPGNQLRRVVVELAQEVGTGLQNLFAPHYKELLTFFVRGIHEGVTTLSPTARSAILDWRVGYGQARAADTST